MDAFPGYTYFNPTRKVLTVMQIIEDAEAAIDEGESVFMHHDEEEFDESKEDSVPIHADSNKITVPAQATTILGKAVSDMISADTFVTTTGQVYGTFNYVTDYDDFSSVPGLTEGYFFPFTLGADITGTTMTILKNGEETKTDAPFDPEFVFRVTADDVFTILVDETEAVTLKFDKAVFNSKAAG